MGLEIGLLAGTLIVLAVAIFAVPLIGARLELKRLQRDYELSDEEVSAYARELPEVCHAVAESLGEGSSTREVRRIASESAIMAILRERQRGRRRTDADGRAAMSRATPNRARPEGLTPASLREGRPRKT